MQGSAQGMIEGRMTMGGIRYSGGDVIRGQTTIRVAIVFTFMSVLLLLILVLVPSDRTEPSVLVLLFGLPCLTAVALKSRVKSPDYFEIIYPILLLYFLSFCFRGAVLIANPADLHPEVNGFSAVNKALGLGLLGLISMWLGYYCLSKNPGRRISALANKLLPDEWRVDTAIVRILLLFIIGISIQIVGVFAGLALSNTGVGLDPASGFFGVVGYLSTISLILFSLFVFRRKASGGRMLLTMIVWCGMLLLQALLAFITGSRGPVLISFFFVPMICYNYTVKHINMKQLVTLVVIMLVVTLVIIMPLARPLRATRIMWFAGSLSEYLRTLRTARQESSKQTLGDTFIEFTQRQIVLENFAIAISKTPDVIPYKNGKTFLSVATNLIPRFIWSKRVAYDYNYEFSKEYAGWQGTRGSTGATNIGELYMNFGITGLVIGMFILGLLYRSIYKNLIGTQAVGDLKILVYSCFLLGFMWIEGGLGPLIVDILIKTLTLIAVVLFLRVDVGKRKQPMQFKSP